MSESVDDGQPEGSGQPRTNDQPAGGGQSRTGGGQPGTSGAQPGSSGGQPRSSGAQPRTNGQSGGASQARRGNDPLADFQRWLMRAGARSMANQVADQVRRTVGQERRDRGDVWDTATNEPPPDESPECQWCPICQAARAARLSGPGLMSSVADVGGALAAMAQDALSAFEQMIKTQDQNRSTERTGIQRPKENGAVPPEPTEPTP